MQYFNSNHNKFSKICLGTWSLSGKNSKIKSYERLNEKKIYTILEEALKKKINFFDTAPVYGLSEKYLGKFIHKIREKIIVSSKVGCVSFNKKLNFRKKNINNQIESIKKNLKTDYIDIIQLYNPNPHDPHLMSALELLDKLKSKKIIKLIGVTLNNPEDYIKLRKLFKFEFVQCNFNFLDQRILDLKILDLIKKDKSTLYARTILNFGIFTETFLKKNKLKFASYDHRSKWKIEQIHRWANYAKKVKSLSNRNLENTSYKFVNSYNIDGLIIGATKKVHIETACKKSNFKRLSKSELNKINEIYSLYNNELLQKPYYRIKS